MKIMSGLAPPNILGGDFSGTVEGNLSLQKQNIFLKAGITLVTAVPSVSRLFVRQCAEPFSLKEINRHAGQVIGRTFACTENHGCIRKA